MTIKLSELEVKIAAMTPGRWRYDQDAWVETTLRQDGLETEVLLLGARNDPDDGIGVVALRNSAKTLIAIAKAAHDVYRLHAEAVDGFDDEAHADRWRGDFDAAESTLKAALSKVKP